jgi:hypothetical protein
MNIRLVTNALAYFAGKDVTNQKGGIKLRAGHIAFSYQDEMFIWAGILEHLPKVTH